MNQRDRVYAAFMIAAVAVYAVVPVIVAAGENAKLEVDDYAFCTSVENREPINRERAFSPDVGRVYLWTLIAGAGEPAKIKHVWYYGDKKMNKVKLDIAFEQTRTWSYKNILPSQTGDWYVDIIDCHGNLLRQVSFEVTD